MLTATAACRRAAHTALVASSSVRVLSGTTPCVAAAAAAFHSAASPAFAAAAAKPAGKPAVGAASGPAKPIGPPAPDSRRYFVEGWNAPRLVPVVKPEPKVDAQGHLLQPGDSEAALDAAEMAAAHEIPTLHGEVRERVGSKYSREVRAQLHRIPGIICDRANPRRNQLLITLDRFELEALARKYRRTLAHKVCQIKIEGQEPILVIPDEITRHAVSQELLVANWFLFKPHAEKVRIKMPIVYTGTEECIGVKRGGVVVILRDHVPCVWTGDEHIPPFLHIDMTNTDGGKVFRNADLKLPSGLRLHNPQFDYVVATVLGFKSKGGREDEDVAAAGAGAAAATAQQPSAIQLEKEKKAKERAEEEALVQQKLAQAAAKRK